MKLHTYINFAGNCAEALDFYEQQLGGQILMRMTYAEGPEPEKAPEGMENAVLHARIRIGQTMLMASDGPIDPGKPMGSAFLALSMDSTGEAERVFGVLAEGGHIYMPLTETFFAYRFGMLRDRFGVSWMILHEREQG
ncbi:MAG: VOC family protein [Terracidiphilus sp.]|nr:VOC family protein [Terracidiphilus sp.]